MRTTITGRQPAFKRANPSRLSHPHRAGGPTLLKHYSTQAPVFAILRSVIATAQKQRRGVLNTLTGPPESFIKDIRYA